MALRNAWQRLRLAQYPLVSVINRGLWQATGQSPLAYQTHKRITSSSAKWPQQELPVPCYRLFQQLYRFEPCRKLSISFRSEREESEQSTSSSPVEALSARACGDSSDPSEISASVNISGESAYVSSPRHDLAMLFTCTVCETRSAKTMSRASYETGVVIVRCPGCKNLHLIADRYGWFGEKGGVEDFLAEKGIDIKTGSDSSYEFTLEDLTGWTHRKKPEQV